MSTHRIGQGTVNVSANLLVEERDILGRIATKRDMSISRIIREAVTAAITKHDPATGRSISTMRRNRRRDMLSRHNGQLELSL